MKIHSIALVVTWYGPYPWYFTYFVHTIAYSPTVDFYIVTDNIEEIPNKPDNLKIVYRTLDEIKLDFSNKLGFDVNIDSPYKLCDFKPAYGFLFQDVIKEYDFWGHIDLDIVFGDVRGFMTEELLQSYDVISSRHDYTAGYFTLYRNNDFCNLLFRKSNVYQNVFSTPENYWFDECGKLTGRINNSMDILNYPNVFQSMTYVVITAAKEEGLKVFFDFIILDGVPGKISWKDGKIYYKDMFEAMFYHLIQFKSKCKKQTVFFPMPNEFHFTPSRVLRKK